MAITFQKAGLDNAAQVPLDAEVQRTDEELLVRYRRTGDRNLFSELVHRYERELYNYLCRYLGHAEMAEDVFQATFLLVHKKCQQFEEGRRFRPWLYAVATNAAIDAQRRNKRHRAVSLDRVGGRDDDDSAKLVDLLVSDDPDPIAQASRLESGEWVQRALDELSDQMRSVVHLVYYQGLKYREAADALNIPVGTVKSRLHAAIQKLNDYWNETHAD
ncbi:MAG: RNA polymerase subunit sigma-70 [Planctomycetaceae bacterium]|nr:RNA polymerase subunit sigma-70 [Planctomycetaceae bacterium]